MYNLPGDELPVINGITHEIHLDTVFPIHTKQYRYPPSNQEEIKKQIRETKQKGITEESNSPYGRLLWVVSKEKHASGIQKWRFVMDS